MVEYMIRLEAYQLQRIEQQEAMVETMMYYRAAKATDSKGTKYQFKSHTDMFDRLKAIDDVRSSFEENYKPKSKRSNQLTQAQIVAQRMREWREMQKKGES